MKNFRNMKFNRLYEFMKEMDSSDDYMMIQASSLDLGNEGVEMSIMVTGMKKGNDSIHEDDAVKLLTRAMMDNEAFRLLLTKAVRSFEQTVNLSWMRKP